MKTKIYTVAIVSLAFGNLLNAQNVGINTTGTTPNSSAQLDLNTGNTFTSPNGKGLLIPNVSLSTTADNTTVPVGASQQSLLVYNSNNAITGIGAGGKGYYWWDNTAALWINLVDNLSPGAPWVTTGNAGTTASSSAIGSTVNNNFVGTTDAIDFVVASNNLERMRVSSGGVVGIGTNSPATSTTGGTGVGTFHIVSTSQPGNGYFPVEITNNTTLNAVVGIVQLSTTSGYNGSEGIVSYSGTTYQPSGILGLSSAATGYGIGISGITSSTAGYGVYAQAPLANTGGVYGLYVYGRAITTGNWYTTSDARLKTNIVPLTNALDKVLKLQAVDYDFKEEYKDFVESTERQTGFLAQDVEKIMPNVVSSCQLTSKSSAKSNTSTETRKFDAKVVAYSGIVPYLAQAIKEQQQQIEDLKAEIAELKKLIRK